MGRRTGVRAGKLGVGDGVERYTGASCFIALEDHGEGFGSHPKCRLVDPAESSLGGVSGSVLEGVTSNVGVETGAHLLGSAGEVMA